MKRSENYIALFKVSQLICLLFRSIKENDGGKDFYKNEIRKHQDQLPFVDLNYLADILDGPNFQEAQKAIEGIDVLFTTLKKHYPCPYSKDDFFSTTEELDNWLKKGLPNLYYRLF